MSSLWQTCRGVAGAAVLVLATSALAGDWPCYRADAARSGVTAEKLNFPLAPVWIHEPGQAPAPAWPEPGKEVHRLDFDYAFQPVVASGLVYWASSADDALRAVDLKDGRLRWRFIAGGPFRFAPAVANGKVYGASDDGFLYCLDGQDGQLVWRFRAAHNDRQMLGNGRMISRWPCRGGVLVLDGVVHVAAGMWPSEGVFIHALDAATGRSIWRNAGGLRYVNQPHPKASAFTGVTPQGYLLASKDLLLAPSGRSTPAAYDRRSGRLVYYQPYLADAAVQSFQKSGGAWATIAGDLVLNPLHKGVGQPDARVGECPPGRGDGLAAYDLASGKPLLQLPGKHRGVIAAGVLYAVGDGQAVAIDLARWRASKSGQTATKWSVEHGRVYSLALAGDALLVGGSDSVTAFRASDGSRLWSAKVGGQVRGLAVADGRLLAATHTGTIVCFGPGPATQPPARHRHAPTSAGTRGADVALAAQAVKIAGVKEGYALVLGRPDSGLAVALAAQTKLHVISVLGGKADVDAERQRVLATGLYGTRVAIQRVEDLARLPFAPYFADLILVAGEAKGLAGEEVYRVLRPCGGVLLVSPALRAVGANLVKQAAPPTSEVRPSGQWARIVRGALPGAGEWRANWADAGRTGIGNESLVRQPLELLWFGGPGPDRLMDRHFRGSSPLSVHGRVFLPGQDHLIAFDAYTGRELWSRELKGIGRRLASSFDGNVVADDDSVYVAREDRCYRLDQVTGKILGVYQAPPLARPAGRARPEPETTAPRKFAFRVEGFLYPSGWGYLGVSDELILGSRMESAQPGSTDGGRALVFALDRGDGSVRWKRPAARTILNRAIVPGEGRVFVLDATDPDAIATALRRGRRPEIEHSLIALDVKTGKELWRQDDVPAQHYTLQYAQGMVLVGATAAYNARTGKKLWQREEQPPRGTAHVVHGVPMTAWDSGQRGGRISPILGNWIVHTSAAYDLRTGRGARMTPKLFSEGQRIWQYGRSYGCSPVVGCQTMLCFRSGTVGFIDLASAGLSNFGGVRPGCNITMIPAAGLMLIPPGDSGCSCSYNFQTSLALVNAPAEGEVWSVFQGMESANPLGFLHINFGAPGDRRDGGGTPWLGFPRPLAPRAVSVPVEVQGEVAWFHHPFEPFTVPDGEPPWLYASGLQGAARLVIKLASPGGPARPDEGRAYRLRLHFAEPEDLPAGRRVFDVSINGKRVLKNFDIVREAGRARKAVVKQFRDIRAGDTLEIRLAPSADDEASALAPVLNGLELYLQPARASTRSRNPTTEPIATEIVQFVQGSVARSSPCKRRAWASQGRCPRPSPTGSGRAISPASSAYRLHRLGGTRAKRDDLHPLRIGEYLVDRQCSTT